MNKLLSFAICMCISGHMLAQSSTIAPAKPGATYGETIDNKHSISLKQLEEKLSGDTVYTGKISGQVVEVCKKKGCFMRLERANGETVMVRFKDYGFFMPQNIVGKTVVVDGTAKVTETPVERLQHFAKDAGKSDEEIARITVSSKDIAIVASGVLVVK
jgi:hypothetical protein